MTNPENFNEILEAMVEQIDVGESRHEDARSRYTAVGQFLDADDSPLHQYKPVIYVQGSFSLGTAIKPFGEDGEYDVDALCLLSDPPKWTGTQEGYRQWLREIVGARLRNSDRYGPMLNPRDGKRRCWTIQYHDSSRFHLDVCPAIPGNRQAMEALGVPAQIARHSIALTDKTDWSKWISGNALGYREWFRERMRVQFDEGRVKVARAKFARVDDIPDYQVRTTLQKAVQLLKRHRDITCAEDADAPISIIIQTLTARAYDNDPNLARSLAKMLEGMPHHIADDGTHCVISNPVDPSENFADKWIDVPRKREVFFAWLEAATAFFNRLSAPKSVDEAKQLLREGCGVRDANAVIERFPDRWPGWSLWPTGVYALSTVDARTLSASHAKSPAWTVNASTHSATIHCSVRGWQGFRFGKTLSSGEAVPKGRRLRFNVSTTAKSPYTIHWQVTNTGAEAEMATNLRGDFYPSAENIGRHFREETTSYQGTHWVKCYVVKDGIAVAQSEPFFVKITA